MLFDNQGEEITLEGFVNLRGPEAEMKWPGGSRRPH
jgi:hypothetical protein